MKSKISCFNTTIFRKNMTHFWPLWAIYLIYLIFVLPVNIWQYLSPTDYHVENNIQQLSRQLEMLNDIFRESLSPYPIFGMAAVTAMAVFGYLYSTKNANMMHSLPVDRRELFVTNYLSGIIFMLIPELIAFIISVFVCLACQITSIEYVFIWFIYIAGMSFFAFSFAVFVAMLTGQLVAMPAYYLAINYLYVGCLYIISKIVSLVCYGVGDAWNPGKSCILSPIYYLNNNLRSFIVTNEKTNVIEALQMKGGYLIGIYSIAAVLIVIVSYQMYKRRRIETAGDFISILSIKPFFRWAVALCGGTLIAVSVVSAFCEEVYEDSAFYYLLVILVAAGFICFFAAEMLIQKSFKVFRMKRIAEWAVFAVISVAFVGMFRMDVFRIERKLPNAEDVKVGYVSMDYPIEFSGDEIQNLIDIQSQVIEMKDEFISEEADNNYYAEFRYYMNDGTMFVRQYRFPITDEHLADENHPLCKIADMEKQPENLKKHMFADHYSTNEYYSGSIDIYDTSGRYEEKNFSKEVLDGIVEAVMKDIEEGHLEKYWLYSIYGDISEECFFNNVTLGFFNDNGVISSSERFYEYEYYLDDGGIFYGNSGKNGSAFITFGPACTNLIEALEKYKIVDDEWKLMNYNEYDALFQ